MVQQLLICQQRGATDRGSHEKPTRLSARPDSAIGCRVCARDGEEPLALGTLDERKVVLPPAKTGRKPRIGQDAWVRGRTKDIHPPAISFWRGWGLISWIASRWLGPRRRQCHILERSERTLPCEQLITRGNVFLFFHAERYSGRKVSLK